MNRVRRPMRATLGFTLIELVVALTATVILSAIAMKFLVDVRNQASDAGRRGQMTRDAHVVMDTFGHDVRYLGAAVPFDVRMDGTGAGNDMLPAVRRAKPTSMVFFGDLPLPNSEFNGTMSLVEVVNGFTDRIKVTSELSGGCTPPSSGASGNRDCNTNTFSSLSFPGTLTRCQQGNANQRTCPWGLGKWQALAGVDMNFQIVNDQGEWYERQHSAAFASETDGDLQYGPAKLRLDIEGNAGTVGLPVATAGVGSYVTTIDRVFWTVEEVGSPGTVCTTNCEIKRRQCWGAIQDPDAGDTPGWSNTNGWLTSNGIGRCTGEEGTPWETIGTGLTNVRLAYRIDTGWTNSVTTDAEAQQIRAVRLAFTMQRPGSRNGVVLSQSYRRDFFLDNRDQP